MTINRALLKHGYSKFSLEILEYCSLDELMVREKHYMDLLNPEYNILKEPGSPSRGSGWKKSEETNAKFSVGQRTRQKVEVTDLELNTTTEYHNQSIDIDDNYI